MYYYCSKKKMYSTLMLLKSQFSAAHRFRQKLLARIFNPGTSRFSWKSTTMFDAACACGLAPKHSLLSTKETNHVSNLDSNYEAAINALNKLQSKIFTPDKTLERHNRNLEEMEKYLQRTGLTLDDLDKLSVIHVAGTKGKGSTCAYTESILRSFGIKTGFFNSPHLISETERIKINGKPISKEMFAKYFWKIYNALNQQKTYDDDMPIYFKFLNILSLHIFLEEKVDVAIIEVGIGGEKDSTNIIRNTKTVGITSLGLDHTSLLGKTLAEIAWHKAGIIKPNSNVFTSPQPEECMSVIKNRVNEKNAKLFIAPDFNSYRWPREPHLKTTNKVQHANVSLAIQLAYDWLKRNKIQLTNGLAKKMHSNEILLEISTQVIKGLENCFWPGRSQIIEFHDKNIYLDGAHTVESLQFCLEWFLDNTKNRKSIKCLLFNATGDRNSKIFLELINNFSSNYCAFNAALFVPNIAYDTAINENDSNNNPKWTPNQQIKRVKEHANTWINLNKSSCIGEDFPSILEALRYIYTKFDKQEVDILVTGSIYLVGETYLALEEYDRRYTHNKKS